MFKVDLKILNFIPLMSDDEKSAGLPVFPWERIQGLHLALELPVSTCPSPTVILV